MTNIEILTHQALQSIDCKMRDQNEIDWEQRRYEVAKEYYCSRFDSLTTTLNQDARKAVECADILIAELKKQK